jgi:hypothetical protein
MAQVFLVKVRVTQLVKKFQAIYKIRICNTVFKIPPHKPAELNQSYHVSSLAVHKPYTES